MSVTNVLSKPMLTVSIDSQMMRITAVIEGLRRFIDDESHDVIELLYTKGFLEDSSRFTGNINLVEFEEDTPFIGISTILDSQNLFPASASSALDLLYALRGKENEEVRRAFFSKGFTLLSMDSLVIGGKMKYLVIGQDGCSKREQKQRLFSIRLMEPTKLFACDLYRLIAGKLQG